MAGFRSFSAAEVIMASTKQKAFCVLSFARCGSVITVKREFRKKYRINPPTVQSIRRWYHQCGNSGCLCKGKSGGRPGISSENAERVRGTFLRSPKKSTVCASRELDTPHPAVWRVLRKKLCYKPYKLQAPRPGDNEHGLSLHAGEVDDICTRLVCSDEASFHLSGKVNRHNVRIWDLTNPHAWIKHERDSPKGNVFCAMSVSKICGPFVLRKKQSLAAPIWICWKSGFSVR
ncbi:hypothetical protein AVEN_245425-1 [Araneus ventricosus]|uniref:DUF4817 domain-containing protein n=1 Tax=Araneus ventricosus TaxID=182803 RepID=A0A4Y2S6N3_ARAVE|nr:hypothetical protein AVEN_8136-1 [Araneus ventricosus]GBN83631.1 hypothetical protein AVEN_245425-1 [Araneus ventricosus]